MEIRMITRADVIQSRLEYGPQPCFGNYMKKGSEAGSEGDWWCHFCGGGLCPRVAACYDATNSAYLQQEAAKRAERDRNLRRVADPC